MQKSGDMGHFVDCLVSQILGGSEKKQDNEETLRPIGAQKKDPEWTLNCVQNIHSFDSQNGRLKKMAKLAVSSYVYFDLLSVFPLHLTSYVCVCVLLYSNNDPIYAYRMKAGQGLVFQPKINVSNRKICTWVQLSLLLNFPQKPRYTSLLRSLCKMALSKDCQMA